MEPRQKRRRFSRKTKLIPIDLMSFLEMMKDSDPAVYSDPQLIVNHFSNPITSGCTFYEIENDKVFTGHFTPEDPNRCYCILPTVKM